MSVSEINRKFNIILASKSPRRQDILREMGIDFHVVTNNVEESFPEGLDPSNVASYLAALKASAFKASHLLKQGDLVITADTVVTMDQRIYGKPTDTNDAIQMITELSGRSHRVITGVCLHSVEKQVSFKSETTVHFNQLTIEEITYYVMQFQPMDKAGSYAIQEWIGAIGIDRIEGDYLNIVGLPASRLYRELKSF